MEQKCFTVPSVQLSRDELYAPDFSDRRYTFDEFFDSFHMKDFEVPITDR